MKRTKLYLFTFIFYFVFTGAYFCWQDGWRSGLIQAFVGSVIFALMMPFIQKISIKMTIKGIKTPLEGEEQAIFCGGANHFKGVEGVGGKMVLFHDALVFQSHRFNIQRHELHIPLADIAEVNPYPVFGFFPTGLKITTRDGRSEKFVVGNRQEWIDGILAAKAVSI